MAVHDISAKKVCLYEIVCIRTFNVSTKYVSFVAMTE